MESKRIKMDWPDQVRALAIFSVILLHVSAPVMYEYGTLSDFDWWVGNIVDGSVRFCIPLFLMLTGALVLSQTDELSDFLKKRTIRILLPFLFWSGMYILYSFVSRSYHGERLSGMEWMEYTLMALKDGAAFHLWYVYMVIGLYLFLPIIRKWIVNSKQKEILYLIGIWFITLLLDLPGLVQFKPNIDLRYFSGFIGYPVLGYYLVYIYSHPKVRMFSLCLYITGTLITVIGTYLITAGRGHFYEGLYSYLSPNVVVAAIGLFLFLKQAEIKNDKFSAFIKFISKYSYGIFLSHVLVLIVLSKIGISWSFINPIIGIPFTALLSLALSAGITCLMSKIPYGSYISG